MNHHPEPLYVTSHDFVLSETTFFRWDGSLVEEIRGTSLFGSPIKNAQIITCIGNRLVRRTYEDYWFKGPFGGYWFASDKSFSVWHKMEC